MKKSNVTHINSFLLAALFFIGCQKELKQPIEQIAEQSNAAAEKKSNNCRLTMYHYYDAIADYSQVDYFSYKNGLADEWFVSYGNLFKMEYDSKGKLKISRMYE